MRTLAFVMLATLVAAGTAAAQDVTLEMEAHDEGAQYWFTQAGAEERNPTLTVAPGANVTIILTNVGAQPHNIQIDGIDGATLPCCLSGGQTGNVTFTAPTEPGTYQYYCLPHKAAGMAGSFIVGTADAGDDGEDAADATDGEDGADAGGDEATGQDTPGFALLGALVAVGAAVLVRRK